MSINVIADLSNSGQQQQLYPGDAGWGDVVFVSIWAVSTLLLAAYYVYRAFFPR